MVIVVIIIMVTIINIMVIVVIIITNIICHTPFRGMDRIIRETAVNHTNHQKLSGQYKFNLYKYLQGTIYGYNPQHVQHEQAATKYPAQKHP